MEENKGRRTKPFNTLTMLWEAKMKKTIRKNRRRRGLCSNSTLREFSQMLDGSRGFQNPSFLEFQNASIPKSIKFCLINKEFLTGFPKYLHRQKTCQRFFERSGPLCWRQRIFCQRQQIHGVTNGVNWVFLLTSTQFYVDVDESSVGINKFTG